MTINTMNGTTTIDTARGFDILGAKGQVVDHVDTYEQAKAAIAGTRRTIRYWGVGAMMEEGE